MFFHRLWAPFNARKSKPFRFGSAVTVVEMDGEIDMDNMEEQLKDGRQTAQFLGIFQQNHHLVGGLEHQFYFSIYKGK